jgi:hypothetical protein
MSIDDQSLTRAYDLIEEDRLDEARAILEPILEIDKENTDAWWLYAHAVTDPEQAKQALSNVQRLDPEYPELDELLQTFEPQSRISSIGRLQSPSLLPPLPATLPGIVDDEEGDDDWDALDEEEDDSLPLWRRPAFLLAVGLLIFVIVAALVIFRPGDQPQVTATTTDVASNQSVDETPTIPFIAVESPVPAQTEGIPTEESFEGIPTLAEETSTQVSESAGNPTSPNFDTLSQSLANFTLAEAGISTEQTSLGNTVVANVCTTPGAELRSALEQVMSVLANNATGLGVDALGTRMLDCTTNTPLLVIGASANDMTAYATGSLTEREFQARWQPVG